MERFHTARSEHEKQDNDYRSKASAGLMPGPYMKWPRSRRLLDGAIATAAVITSFVRVITVAEVAGFRPCRPSLLHRPVHPCHPVRLGRHP